MSRKILGGIASVLLPMGAYAGGYVRAPGAYQRSYSQAAASALPNSLPLAKTVTPRRPAVASSTAQPNALALVSGQVVRELLIIDASVGDKHTLYRDLKPGVAVAELNADADGLQQLLAILAAYHGLRAVHVVAHARDGELALGNSTLTTQRVRKEVELFSAIDHAIRPGGDLLIYGCDLASGAQGEAMLDILAANTQVDLAASNDATGSAVLAGDWELEITRGDIESALPFSARALADFSGVLAFSGTITFDTVNYAGSYGSAANAAGRGDGSKDARFGGAGSYELVLNGQTFNTFGGYGYGTSSENETSMTLSFTGGASFTAGSIGIWNLSGTTDTFVITGNAGGSVSSGAVSNGGYVSVNLSSLTAGATSLTISAQDGQGWVYLNDFVVSSVQPALDSDGTLTASATVTEPVGLDTTVDTVGEAVNVFDFTLTDAGTADGAAMTVSQVVMHVSGTSTDTERGQITWRLNGPDVSNVTGTYNSGSDTLTFSGLSVSVANGASETYTVNAYYNTNTGITEDHTVILSVDGDTDLTMGGSGTQMGTTTAVTNGTGTTLDVVATQLVFTTQPAGSVSGSALSTQPVIAARDAFGNTDVDFAETITLTEASSGTLTNNTATASSGVATFSTLTYTASADQENFTLTANDQDGVGSDLSTVDASAVTSDVVATKLIYSTQPAPLSVNDGAPTAMTTVPVVSAVDANNTVDTGYSTDIVLAEANGAGAANLSATGDTDGNSTTVSLTPSSGVATFTGLSVTYSAIGSSNETFNLRASSGGLTSADSSVFTAVVDSTPPTGYAVSFDQAVANASNANAISFTFTGAEIGATYDYTVSNTPGSISASGTVTSATQQISVPNANLLNDGTLTLSFYLTDTNSNVGATVQDTLVKDTVSPSGHSVSLDDNVYNAAETSSASFTFASAEVGADFSYSISSSGGGTNVTGSGTLASATQQVTGVDISGLGDGTLTLSATLTDTAGNPATAATDTASLDTSAPGLSGSIPADGATTVQYNADVTLQFGENVSAGSGSISIYDAADDSLLEAISIASASISGTDVTVNPSVSFTPTRSYYVQAAAGVVVDGAGNGFAGISDKTTLNFTVANNVPTASADSASTDEDNAVAIDVLANDSDSDGSLNPASVTIVTAPTNGSTSINTGTGVVTYTPTANYNGSDSFTYTVDDLLSGTSAATTVSITINSVNDAPVAVADVASTPEDTAISIDVAANDTDVDTGDAVDPATLTVASQPTNGSAAVIAGEITYTPNANFSGSDSFTYRIQDQNGADSNIATVTLNVSGVNDAPVAVNDSATTDEDTAVDIDLVANDTDVDGTVDATTVSVVAQPANGAVSINASTGVATFTPTADFNGADSFTYVVQDDGGATSAAGTVSITINSVNDAPVANNDTVNVQEDLPYNINALGNDADVDGTLQSGTLEIVTDPVNGAAVVSAGVITYTPGAEYSGSDSLTYRVQDNQGAWSNTATVAITVDAVNDVPVANDDSATTDEDTAVIISVLDNDSDIDGTLDLGTIVVGTGPSSGNVTDNGDGTLTYTPAADSNGSDSFTYTVQDNAAGSSNTATVSVTVNAVNDAPVISGTPTTSLLEGQAYSFTPAISDVDSSGLSVSAINLPAWLNLDSGTGALTGTPQVGDAGDYSGIVLTVSDGNSDVDLAIFSITVLGDNDTDGTDDATDTDDDNDGMSDAYEVQYGFNPLDPADASEDRDGDTISNLQESIDNTDPDDQTDYVDVTAPIITAPQDIVVDANALFTPVPLATLLGLPLDATASDLQDGLSDLVYDNVDGAGCCNNAVVGLSAGKILLAPGTNSVTYRAVDAKGNIGTAVQTVKVRPLVSVNKDQISVEGATVQFRIILNGQSPFYPLTVPYVIDAASTADNVDHDLVDGSVVLTNGQTSASVSIQLTDDMTPEGNEVLIIKLDDQTTDSEDLANGYDEINPDIYDINSGAKTSHRITITEANVAPDVTLTSEQGSVNTILITPDGGAVTLTASITDPNSGDSHSLNWSATDASLVDTDGDTTDATLVFDPTGLSAGTYKAQVTATDDGGASDTATLYFSVVASLPTLGTDDTDGDGADDATEGTADSDDDGIPDYLDNISASNVVPETVSVTDAYLLECDPGVRCRLGQFALGGSTGGARLPAQDLVAQGVPADTDFNFGNGIFDFEIHDLPTLGQTVSIVLPQTSAIPPDAVYRKYANGQWHTFVSNANNAISSSAGSLGYCPPPGDSSWESGLVEGYYCVQLSIEDGGPNDTDGLVNASVEDPGGVAVLSRAQGDVEQTFPNIRSKSKHSGGATGGWLLLMLGALATTRRVAQTKRLLLALLATTTLSLVSPRPGQAMDLETIQQNSYVSLALYQASGSQSKSDFQQGLTDYGVSTQIHEYDVSRTAYQITSGYRYHKMMAVELGYLDLGEATVDFSATGTPNNLQAALDRHYPVSGSGWTLTNRFQWPLEERLSLSAELGIYVWDGKVSLSGADVRPDMDGDTDLLMGLAMLYQLNPNIGLALQGKSIFFDDQQVNLLGLEIRFGF